MRAPREPNYTERIIYELYKILGSRNRVRYLCWNEINLSTKQIIIDTQSGIRVYNLTNESCDIIISIKKTDSKYVVSYGRTRYKFLKDVYHEGEFSQGDIKRAIDLVKKYDEQQRQNKKAEEFAKLEKSIPEVSEIDLEIDSLRPHLLELLNKRNELLGLPYDCDNVNITINHKDFTQANYSELKIKEIAKLDLSARVYNALARTGIENINDAIEIARNEDKALAIRNFGVKSLDELRGRLSDYGYI